MLQSYLSLLNKNIKLQAFELWCTFLHCLHYSTMYTVYLNDILIYPPVNWPEFASYKVESRGQERKYGERCSTDRLVFLEDQQNLLWTVPRKNINWSISNTEEINLMRELGCCCALLHFDCDLLFMCCLSYIIVCNYGDLQYFLEMKVVFPPKGTNKC